MKHINYVISSLDLTVRLSVNDVLTTSPDFELLSCELGTHVIMLILICTQKFSVKRPSMNYTDECGGDNIHTY